MTIRSAIRSAIRSPIRGALESKWGSGNGLTVSAPSALLFAVGDQPYTLENDEKISFSVSPTLYKGLEGSFDYYIDATNGSDGNAGTSEGAAWASLSKIAGLTYSGSPTYRVLVKSDTYDTADDHIRISNTLSGWNIEIVFEPGCIIDGGNYSSGNAIDIDGANGSLDYSAIIYGNGLIVRDVQTATGNGFSPQGGTIELWDTTFDNCVDNISTKGDGFYTLYDCRSINATKYPLATGGSGDLILNRCVISDAAATATLGGLATFVSTGSAVMNDTVFVPGSTSASKTMNASTSVQDLTFNRCRIGTLTVQVILGGAANWGAVFNSCWVNVFVDLNQANEFYFCYGKATFRQRNGGSLTLENSVLVGPASNNTAIFLSNFDPGSGSAHYVRDNIFETATAGAFMSYDATNAAYVIAAGSEFFNNILSGSAAFDADLVSADSGGTVIVDNVSDDALIGSANTFDPDDYGYGAGSPAIGAGVSGGNSGFAIGDVTALAPMTTQITASIAIDDGDLTLSQTDYLTFTTGDGTADASLVFYGHIYYVLAALDGTSIDNASPGSPTITGTITHDATGRSKTFIIPLSVTSDPSFLLMSDGSSRLLLSDGSSLLKLSA